MSNFCVNCFCELEQPEQQISHPNFSDWCSDCFSEFLELISERINLDNPGEIECLTCDGKFPEIGEGYFADCALCDSCQEIFFSAYLQAVKKMIQILSENLNRRGD